MEVAEGRMKRTVIELELAGRPESVVVAERDRWTVQPDPGGGIILTVHDETGRPYFGASGVVLFCVVEKEAPAVGEA
jgi:hypothetical protein